MKHIKLLSVVIPVYNEEKALADTLADVRKALAPLTVPYELIAVNDGSSDNSGSVLDGIEGIRVIHNAYNMGYGASLKRGISASTGDWILITDADGTYPVRDIPRLLEHAGTYDMVVGSRTGKNVAIPLARKPAKFIIGALANMLAGQKIPDLNSGFRVFRKEIALRFFHLFPQRFSFTITITLACLTSEYTVKYIPTDYYLRKGSSSIHPIKDFIGFLSLIVRMTTIFRPMTIFVPISFALFLLSIGVLVFSYLWLPKILDVTVLLLFLASLQVFLFGLLAEAARRR